MKLTEQLLDAFGVDRSPSDGKHTAEDATVVFDLEGGEVRIALPAQKAEITIKLRDDGSLASSSSTPKPGALH